MLVEAGRIGLDDPLKNVLPEFEALQVQPSLATPSRAADAHDPRPAPADTSASLRFMTTCGCRKHTAARVDDGLAAPDLRLGENMRRLAQAPLQAQPGTRWGGRIVLRRAGRRDRAGPTGNHSTPWCARACRDSLGPRIARLPRSSIRGGPHGHPDDGGRKRRTASIVSEENVPFPVTGGRILFDPERAFYLTPIRRAEVARSRPWSTTCGLPGSCSTVAKSTVYAFFAPRRSPR